MDELKSSLNRREGGARRKTTGSGKKKDERTTNNQPNKVRDGPSIVDKIKNDCANNVSNRNPLPPPPKSPGAKEDSAKAIANEPVSQDLEDLLGITGELGLATTAQDFCSGVRYMQ